MSYNNRKRTHFTDPDGPLMMACSKLIIILATGFLWVLTSLPMLTIGASSSALYYVMLKTVRGEDEHYIQNYFRAFRRDFKQATVVWLLFLAVGGIFAFSALYYLHIDHAVSQWIGLLFVALAVVLLIVLIYAFPLISRFSHSTRNLLMLALVLPFKNLKRTIALILMTLVAVVAVFLFPPLIFFGCGILTYGSSLIFVKIFQPLENAIEEKNNHNNPTE